MRLLLVGPPGSGKGTQAKILSSRLDLYHVGMGDLLREAIRNNTDAGNLAEPFVKTGRLVSDAVVNAMMVEKFNSDNHPVNFVMDGYPRTISQAKAFETLLQGKGLSLDAVIQLLIADEEIVRRLSGRRICSNCGASYHVVFNPPKVPEVCDLCGSPLEQRGDDSEETIRNRLLIYHHTHDDLIKYYDERGLLRQVSATDPIEEVFQNIRSIVEQE